MENKFPSNRVGKITAIEEDDGVLEMSHRLLSDVRSELDSKKSVRVPIAGLAALGAGISSLIPALNTVTSTATLPTNGLFRIANQALGDTLKMAKNGNAWGAMRTANGGSKLVQLAEAGPITVTSQAAAALNPATMMMAAALYSIETQLSEIAKTQKQILSFLEIRDEASVEADLETLTELITNYKHNWDNPVYVRNAHKLVMDIKRAARTNMLSCQKNVEKYVSAKKLVVAHSQVNSALADLEKRFAYYKLALYTYSLASVMEILLGENYAEAYISNIQEEITRLSDVYRDLFEKGSHHLEKLGEAALDANVLKSVGTAGQAVGKLIGSIPLIKEGPIDEFLQDSGAHLTKNAIGMEKEAVHRFASISNPDTHVFINRMEDMIQIFDHTEQIYFDNKNIYLVTDKTA